MLRDQPQIVAAASIARMFRIDPVVVLNESDPVSYAARIAAFGIIADAEKAAYQRT